MTLTLGGKDYPTGALIVAGALLIWKWDWVKEKIREIWERIKEYVYEAVEDAAEIVGRWAGWAYWALTHPAEAAKVAWNTLKAFFKTLWDNIKTTFKDAWDWIQTNVLNPMWAAIERLWGTMTGGFSQGFAQGAAAGAVPRLWRRARATCTSTSATWPCEKTRTSTESPGNWHARFTSSG